MKVIVSELSGDLLDRLVAKCERVALVDGCIFTKDPDDEQVLYSPTTDYSQGGPIMDREKLVSSPDPKHNWLAKSYMDLTEYYGDTRLIAAMRCYVASQLGHEIEVPDELIK